MSRFPYSEYSRLFRKIFDPKKNLSIWTWTCQNSIFFFILFNVILIKVEIIILSLFSMLLIPVFVKTYLWVSNTALIGYLAFLCPLYFCSYFELTFSNYLILESLELTKNSVSLINCMFITLLPSISFMFVFLAETSARNLNFPSDL